MSWGIMVRPKQQEKSGHDTNQKMRLLEQINTNQEEPITLDQCIIAANFDMVVEAMHYFAPADLAAAGILAGMRVMAAHTGMWHVSSPFQPAVGQTSSRVMIRPIRGPIEEFPTEANDNVPASTSYVPLSPASFRAILIDSTS